MTFVIIVQPKAQYSHLNLSEPSIENQSGSEYSGTYSVEDKLVFGLFAIGNNFKSDDAERYSFQFQSYLADVDVCPMLVGREVKSITKQTQKNIQCKDIKSARRIGRLLGVKYMGYGSVKKILGWYSIKVGVVEVRTGKKIVMKKRRYSGNELTFFREIIPQVAFSTGEALIRKGVRQSSSAAISLEDDFNLSYK